MQQKPDYIIAGAGLVGSLLGLRLAQRGFRVKLYESRSDMRKADISAGRSINLALSDRGIRSLELVGLKQEMLQHAVPMQGRMVHDVGGNLQFQPYSERPGEHINSISRRTLNVILMDALEKMQPDAITFNTELSSLDFQNFESVFQSRNGERFMHQNIPLLATDGANSVARKELMRISPLIRFNYAQNFQNYGYKELTIPPAEDGSFRIHDHSLHIWPRGHFMMIALPNPDATFTATLFLPYEGKESFAVLQTEESVTDFYSKYFADSMPHIPALTKEFFEHPTGHLYTVKCHPWYYQDQLQLLGDAAHAIIPFYGQGMNCGFEDVFVLDQLMDQKLSGEELFQKFTDSRKINSDAIADLAEDNFIEMRDKVGDPVFQRKRALENRLEKFDPSYFSKYALVTFRPDVSYHHAMTLGRMQDELLMQICSSGEEINDASLPEILLKLKKLTLENSE
ncbi:MAG: FAD-dependent monooxygenase [Saprospiraceae bacterium]|nr:FAD-dependent monooxygenase [Saprospiraceae bacterium]MBK7810934.1 FAD-dependent monooxygenase [Saprospiraceae bacterium]